MLSALFSSAVADAAAPLPKEAAVFSPSNVLAWCIVPYDIKERGPVERMAMLRRLGIEQYVWDWRAKHLPQLPAEIEAARDAGITLRGIWLWIDEEQDRVGRLGDGNQTVLRAVAAARQPTEFWVGVHPNVFAGLDQERRVQKGIELMRYVRDEAARVGGTIALYNHGDWFGQPANQLAIIEAIDDPRIGMVYNFHHERAQRRLFAEYLPRMLPHLRAVNLTGLPEGEAGVFPLGSGTGEIEVLRQLVRAGYTGALGILGHVEDADAEEILQQNLAGLRRLAAQL